ncbi:unnamed protein product [Protopolystoma xenopodis]|uniref:Uncharacterized protein n=1 Tax=Protopolystoma xenopodis TaxID=117903 RepID=A0A3S5CBX6_9PLAT|nr:unnamed protein product [Protopolystoma xenopodis]
MSPACCDRLLVGEMVPFRPACLGLTGSAVSPPVVWPVRRLGRQPPTATRLIRPSCRSLTMRYRGLGFTDKSVIRPVSDTRSPVFSCVCVCVCVCVWARLYMCVFSEGSRMSVRF